MLRIAIFFISLVSLTVNAESLEPIDKVPDDIKSEKVIIPIYSQKLAFRLPTDWKPAFKDQNANMFMIEFTPKNESIKSWSNLLSLQGFKNLAARGSSEQFLDQLASVFKSTCGEYLIYEKIDSPIIDGYESTSAILGCSKMPKSHQSGVKKGQSEVGYYHSIRGEKDIYFIHKSIRGDSFENSKPPLTKDNVASFFKSFMPIELCQNSGGQAECIK